MRPWSHRYRISPAQQGPAQGPLPKGDSQSLARPSGPAPEGTVSRPPSHTAPQARPPGLRPPLTFDDAGPCPYLFSSRSIR
ncbi:proline-rich proteoglycan 2-like [Mustela nigripes]|uniref:proline-rich proteoglycan 2-like n=1 Tax=Mustela nigripes TaxID=77151 RepID=UPI002814AAA9|nr:proline-rich proteoglycan 2-like [Mustela nigripes]